MDANLKDQILNLIDKSQSILLLTHAKADCDGLGAMISMYLALQGMGKEVVAATNDPAPDNLNFLPSINIVQNSIASKNFVITLDLSKTPLNKIKYKLAEDQKSVNIVVTPSNGRYNPEDVSFNHEAGSFDLIITLDTGNLEHLGPIYDQNSELFFKIPVINIDHHASNTDFGQVNLVDVVAASTTEVLLELLEEMEKKYQKKIVDEDVATLLMAGLITDTGSFQHANTSPRSMETAAKLLDLGARQQEIIKNIYKTKKLSTLKLWGNVLSRVQTDPIYRLVWSTISKQDLEESGASSEESESIIDDLLSNAPNADIIMLFKHNDEGYVSVSMRSTTNSADVGKICQEMGGGGHVRAAGFKRRDSVNLEQLVDDTLNKVRDYQGQRLNIHPEAAKEIMEKVEKAPEAPAPQPQETPQPEAQPEAPKPEENKSETTQYLDFKAEKAPETPAPQPQETPQPEAQPEAPKPEENSEQEKTQEESAPRPKRRRPRNRPRPKSEEKVEEKPQETPVPAPEAPQAEPPQPEVQPEAPQEIPPAEIPPAPQEEAPAEPQQPEVTPTPETPQPQETQPEQNQNTNNPNENVQPTT